MFLQVFVIHVATQLGHLARIVVLVSRFIDLISFRLSRPTSDCRHVAEASGKKASGEMHPNFRRLLCHSCKLHVQTVLAIKLSNTK